MYINCKETKTIYYWSLLWSPPRYIYKMIGALKYIVDSFRQSNEKIIIINWNIIRKNKKSKKTFDFIIITKSLLHLMWL